MKIAVIPARGGSKRIPRKNIKDFCGKPMIAWSIEAAKASSLFDHIIVSTDDTEIADIAMVWGAEVPFVRPLKLSDDYAGTTEVVAHSTRWSIDQGWAVSAVCCIYATAPFVQADDLRRGLKLLESGRMRFLRQILQRLFFAHSSKLLKEEWKCFSLTTLLLVHKIYLLRYMMLGSFTGDYPLPGLRVDVFLMNIQYL